MGWKRGAWLMSACGTEFFLCTMTKFGMHGRENLFGRWRAHNLNGKDGRKYYVLIGAERSESN